MLFNARSATGVASTVEADCAATKARRVASLVVNMLHFMIVT